MRAVMWRTLALTVALFPVAAGATVQTGAPAAQEPVLPPVISTQPTIAGIVFADSSGKTLYQSDRDQTGSSSCQDTCLKDWTPLPAAWVTTGVGDWTVIARADGSRQWAYKNKPVYTFNRDRKVGDAKGVEADGAWHPLMKSAKFLPPNVVIRSIPYSNLPPALATADGKTLYLLDRYKFNPQGTQRHDKLYGNPGPAGCTGDCTKTWIPLTAPANAQPADDWSVVTRDDGSSQWAYKTWPVYTYALDTKPGDAKGEGNMHIENGITGTNWEVATLP
jgi:predicted lipoprotein with Yx(FWY)xxD motif